jgi:integrase
MLTDAIIRNTKPKDKPFKLTDGAGLYLLINPTGSRLWRLRYHIGGLEKKLSIGPYPEVSLKEAREKAVEAKKAIRTGIDPSQAKKAQKASASGADSFETIAREWFEKFSPGWAPGHAERVIRLLERDVFPWIGNRPIKVISAPELLSVLRRVESRGAVDTAHRCRQTAGAVFRYAIATGRAERDPVPDLRGAIPLAREGHMASITDPKAVGGLLRGIDDYQGGLIVRSALRLAPYVFVRPGELRRAEWKEIDFERGEWVIPAEKMKMREPHIVPLSLQALEILREIQPFTGGSAYVFPSPTSMTRPISDMALLTALRRMGISKEEMTIHGFRSTASTLLNAQGWSADVIERQLAHVERNKVRAAYNRHDYLPERRKMMQAWANYLDELKAGGEVIPFRKMAE